LSHQIWINFLCVFACVACVNPHFMSNEYYEAYKRDLEEEEELHFVLCCHLDPDAYNELTSCSVEV
jgi:hypothetical protein